MLKHEEYQTINDLHKMAEEHGKAGDGMDRDLIDHIQGIQKILMTRAGSRSWVELKSNEVKNANTETVGQNNSFGQTHGPTY